MKITNNILPTTDSLETKPPDKKLRELLLQRVLYVYRDHIKDY